MRYKATAQLFGILKTLSDTTLLRNGHKKLIILEKMAAIWMVNYLTWPIISQQIFARTALLCILCSVFCAPLILFDLLRLFHYFLLCSSCSVLFHLLFLLCSACSPLITLLRRTVPVKQAKQSKQNIVRRTEPTEQKELSAAGCAEKTEQST